MLHWHVSSALGFVLAGQWRPVCSLSQSLPPCRARRAFEARMDRAFSESGHCRRIHDTYLIARFLRGPLDC